MPAFIDITNQRYGRLTVIGFAGHNSSRRTLWRCRCDCGGFVEVTSNNLRTGNTTACNCMRSASLVSRNYRHGLRHSPLYTTYQNMLIRCYDPTHRAYKWYGALDVTVCERWRGPDGFINFAADMSPRPAGLTLDRINPHGNYEPSNCRWATWKIQRQNRRSSNG